MNEGKPENIVAKMVEGRISKYFEEICLLEQAFVKDSDQKVGDLVKSTGGTLKNSFAKVLAKELKTQRKLCRRSNEPGQGK